MQTMKNKLLNAEKQLYFDFESVRVCDFDIDLGMSSHFSALHFIGEANYSLVEQAKRVRRYTPNGL